MLYTFIDGHIYYNKSVIKIRYDLLEQSSSKKSNMKEICENEAFDYFEKILVFDENDLQTVQVGLPLANHTSHRLIFVSKSKKLLSQKNILILPYPHERKIHLNSLNLSYDYFQTSHRKELIDG